MPTRAEIVRVADQSLCIANICLQCNDPRGARMWAYDAIERYRTIWDMRHYCNAWRVVIVAENALIRERTVS
jgi:hypothetical protein